MHGLRCDNFQSRFSAKRPKSTCPAFIVCGGAIQTALSIANSSSINHATESSASLLLTRDDAFLSRVQLA